MKLLFLLFSATAISAFTGPSVFRPTSQASFALNAAKETNLDAKEVPSSEIIGAGFETGVIPGVREDEPDADIGLGGVRMTESTCIKIAGPVPHKPGSASADFGLLDNFLKVVEVSSSAVGGSIAASGVGKEWYKDPGQTTEKYVEYAPMEAIKACLATCGSLMGSKKVVINVLGGEDLQTYEVQDAVEKFVVDSDIATGASVQWNSIAFKEFPNEECSVTVVAFDNAPDTEALSGVEKSLAEGEIYMSGDKYFSLNEDDVVEDFDDANWPKP